jgi:NADPH:quinone reductase-like Zn-dependent oxidoreductase
MRAVMVREFGGIENAALGDVPKPAPRAGEVLVEVHATAVNFVDLIMMSGKYQFKPALPFVPGKLPAGVVAAAGPGVTSFKVGDHAIAMAEHGGFAEFVAMPESQCIKLPASMPFTEAAAMSLVYDTAYFALRDRAGRKLARHERQRGLELILAAHHDQIDEIDRGGVHLDQHLAGLGRGLRYVAERGVLDPPELANDDGAH